MKQTAYRQNLFIAAIVAIALSACSSPANKTAMTPQGVVVAKHH